MLFYSCFIRYLIKSNLVLTHNTFFFLAFMFSYQTLAKAISSSVYILIMIIVILWPISISYFLFKNKSKLNEQDFKTKYSSLYEGLRTSSRQEWSRTNYKECERTSNIQIDGTPSNTCED